MRAIVTGGAGFVGSHLVEELQFRGAEVVCLERPGAGRGWLKNHDVEFHDCGLTDIDTLKSHVKGADVIYHLAALTEARTPAECYNVNTTGTANLVQAAAQCGQSVPRLIFMSSLAAVGPDLTGACLDQDSAPLPLSHYGRSKLHAEAVIHAYSDRVPSVICRFPAIYGPRDRVVLKLFRMVTHGFAMIIGPWDREISVLHVSDAVQGLVGAAALERAEGQIYCLANSRPTTWGAFVQAIGRALDCHPRQIAVPVWAAQPIALAAESWAILQRSAAVLNRDRVREMSQKRWVCDSSRAHRDFGFQPRFGLDSGIANTADWLRREQWI
ncbi:MAG: dihydroflavonol-4-reductase [Candidatus Krumholzibacteriia bacterium]|jgi:dihydroflavonol-4-reductase